MKYRLSIQEMNDWKTYFALGTKGQKKTDKEVLDYVEGLLMQSYDNEERVKNNRIAPWLIKSIETVGVGNIDTETLDNINNIIEWYKITGNQPNGTIDAVGMKAAEFLTKAKSSEKARKEKEEQLKSENKLTKDELSGKIQRIATLSDGRFWVKVLDPKWFEELCDDGDTWGVMCQATTGGKFAKSPYSSYSLLGNKKGDPLSPLKTLGSIAFAETQRGIMEYRQSGNQDVGSQSIYGYNDLANVFMGFILHGSVKNLYDKFVNGSGGVNEHNDYHYGLRALKNILTNHIDLFSKLIEKKPEILLNNRQLIVNVKGEDFLELYNKNLLQEANNDPVNFIQNLEKYINIFGSSKIKEAFADIDLKKIINNNQKLVVENLDAIAEIISIEQLDDVYYKLNWPNIIKNHLDVFESVIEALIKRFSYSKVLDILKKNKDLLVSVEGGGIKGFIKFINILKFINVPANEVDNVIQANKDFIIQSYDGDEQDKDFKYLRFRLSNMSKEDAYKILQSQEVKDMFISYYENLNDKNKNTQGFKEVPGILQYYSTFYGKIPTELSKDKSLRSTKEDDIFKGSGNEFGIYSIFSMDLKDILKDKNKNQIIKYYSNLVNKDKLRGGSPIDLGVQKYIVGVDKFIDTLKFSGANKEQLKSGIDMLEPVKISDLTKGKYKPTIGDYAKFFDVVYKNIGSKDAVGYVEKYKNDIIKTGVTGGSYYNDWIRKYSESKNTKKLSEMSISKIPISKLSLLEYVNKNYLS